MATVETFSVTELTQPNYTKAELVDLLDSVDRDVRHNGGRHVKFAFESTGDDFGDTVMVYAQGYRYHEFKPSISAGYIGRRCNLCNFAADDEIHDRLAE